MAKSKYKKLSHREHVLLRKNMYCGDSNNQKATMFVADKLTKDFKIIEREIDYNAALLKLFDEIISNASDAAITTGEVKYIKTTIKGDTITVENDCGKNGIPVIKDPIEKIWTPELIFAHFLTGENYEDDVERFKSGQNGLGAKLVSTLSNSFIVEIADGKKKYTQEYKNNLTIIGKPKVVASKKRYVKITFTPDFTQFKDTDGITEDFKSLVLKRISDLCAYNPKVKYYYNGFEVKIKTFEDWIKLHTSNDVFIDEVGDWKYGVCLSEEGFKQTSICSSVSTYKGGTHINYVAMNVSKSIHDKLPKSLNTSWSTIKNKLHLFLIAKVPNPFFDSQVKESLINQMTKDITSSFDIKSSFIKKILKSEIYQSIVDEIHIKEKMQLKKISSGKKQKNITIKKLSDANKAGTKDSNKCALFLTEGDSAKTFVISGMSVVGRDLYGAYPLKGKIMNVRDANIQKIQKNKEIQDLINAIGLVFGKKYEDTSSLRYGKIVLTTDADLDGIHIKGLLINLFEYFWPELLRLDFLYEFITPILKAKKASQERSFYTINDYKKWKNTNPVGWTIKYYKGLGTSSAKESRDYFKELKNHLIPIRWDNDSNKEYIDMIFNKKRPDDRKAWLGDNIPVDVIKYKTPTKISSFFKNEFYHYSMADNVRSIPNIYDGLKPSQRKIIYTMIEKNIKKPISVDSISGQVKSFTKYHHAPESLDKGLIGMSNDFVGSNNLPLTFGAGQFGSRLLGGQDHSAPRYLEACVQNYTKFLIMDPDRGILNHMEEDGYKIEPETFKPIIPLVLVNGADGIGTGYSTSIPKYHPSDIIRLVENKIKNKKSRTIDPYYHGFNGEIIKQDNGNYITYGCYKLVTGSKLHISDLPIGKWTSDFIEKLKLMVEDGEIKDFNDNSSEINIDVTIIGNRGQFSKMSKDEIIKQFDLSSYLYTSNMMLFDDGGITKFNKIEDIIESFYNKRLIDYKHRKNYLLSLLDDKIYELSNKAKFIKMIIDKKLIVNNRKKTLIEKDLKKNKFGLIDNSYDYLLRMPIYSLTKEKYDELMALFDNKTKERALLKKTKIENMWLEDLQELKRNIPSSIKK